MTEDTKSISKTTAERDAADARARPAPPMAGVSLTDEERTLFVTVGGSNTDGETIAQERQRIPGRKAILPSACDAAATKRAAGMVAYVRKCAEKHDELAHAPGVSVDGCMIHEANAHALRVVAAELAEFYT